MEYKIRIKKIENGEQEKGYAHINDDSLQFQIEKDGEITQEIIDTSMKIFRKICVMHSWGEIIIPKGKTLEMVLKD